MKKWVKRQIARIVSPFWNEYVVRVLQDQIRTEIDRLKVQIANTTPNAPILKGFKVYSQCDEDGIIEEILSKLTGNQTFIEIGCGNGLENNTHYLLLKGFSGLWVDGSKDNVNFIRRTLPPTSKLSVRQDFIDLDNIQEIIQTACDFLDTKEPDFFSLDIDGNDVFIAEKALKVFDPKVICVEYNAKFPPPAQLSIAYNSTHIWTGDDYQGASLQMFCDLLANYRLVSCNLSGANAFFVRQDLAEPFEQYPVELLYQPARYDLRWLSSGHKPSLKWLNNSLAE